MKRLLRYLLMRRFDGDLGAEIQAHIDEKAEAYAADGMPTTEAQVRALRDFGNRTRVVENCRESWGTALRDQFTAVFVTPFGYCERIRFLHSQPFSASHSGSASTPSHSVRLTMFFYTRCRIPNRSNSFLCGGTSNPAVPSSFSCLPLIFTTGARAREAFRLWRPFQPGP